MKYSMTYKTALPDTALYELFDRLVDAGRLEPTFHDGEVRTHHEFRDLVRRKMCISGLAQGTDACLECSG